MVGPGNKRSSISLADDGRSPDQVRGDGVYSGRFRSALQAGLHNLRVTVTAPGVQRVITRTLDVEPQPGWECAGAEGLCLRGRFLVAGRWRDARGGEGTADGRKLTEDAGYLTFFHRDNPEVLVKVLDACAAFDRFWIFSTSLTNVEYNLEVKDTSDGTTYQVFNPLGHEPAPVLSTAGPFACGAAGPPRNGVRFRNTMELASPPTVEARETKGSGLSAGRCRSSVDGICLQDGRFRVEAFYTPEGAPAQPARMVRLSDDAGFATFFDRENVELFVKVLDACSWSGSHWVFAGGLTNVGVSLRVHDQATGSSWFLETRPGQTFPSVLDTDTVFTECAAEP